MKRILTLTAVALIIILTFAMSALPVFASEGTVDAAEITETAEANENSVKTAKSYSAAITVGVASAVGAISMAIVIKNALEGIARQPEAEGKIKTNLMLGLVFVETAIIYALIVAILIIFVL